MDVIILAAGRGTRLRPLTDTTPKPLIPVAGKGTLLHTLDALPDTIDRVILVVNHLQEQIRDTVGDAWKDRPVTYTVHDALDGTGGGVRLVRPHLTSERFMVLNGDDVYGPDDLRRLSHLVRGVLVKTQTLTKESDTWVVEDNRLTSQAIRPSGEIGAVNTGAYLLGGEWFDTEPVLVPGKTDEWSLPHALPQILDQRIYHALEAETWLPCGTPEELASAEKALGA